MEDIFNTDFTMDENSQTPKMTKDEFIQKTRSMLQAIMDGYSSNWKDKYNEEDEESEENTCSRCNGFLYICEGGVGDVDCPSCNGTGLNNERVFDTENFVEFIEHGVIFGEQPFLDLLHCEIVNTEQDGSACV
jgi:DnaJ-class molecular chaperone